jgi:hypothetical protein
VRQLRQCLDAASSRTLGHLTSGGKHDGSPVALVFGVCVFSVCGHGRHEGITLHFHLADRSSTFKLSSSNEKSVLQDFCFGSLKRNYEVVSNVPVRISLKG